jgi:hypothetical protein
MFCWALDAAMQIDMASITCAPQMSFPLDPSGLRCSAGFVATLSSVISAKPAELVAKRADAARTQKSLLSTMFLREGAQLNQLAPSSFYAVLGLPLKPEGELPAFDTYLGG